MKNENFKLKIDEPCHENWDEMTPRNNGRYCSSCTKVVVDFSTMSNAGIADYFKTHTGMKICGQFRKSQLETNYTVTYKSPWSFNTTFLRLSLAGILTFSGMKGFSQTKDNCGKIKNPHTKILGGPVSVKTEEVFLRGDVVARDIQVVDCVVVANEKVSMTIRMSDAASGKTITDGTFFINGVSTDYTKIDGVAHLEVSNEQYNRELNIGYYAPGYTSQYKTINFKKQGTVPIILKMEKEEVMMKGQVIVQKPEVLEKGRVKIITNAKKANCTK